MFFFPALSERGFFKNKGVKEMTIINKLYEFQKSEGISSKKKLAKVFGVSTYALKQWEKYPARVPHHIIRMLLLYRPQKNPEKKDEINVANRAKK